MHIRHQLCQCNHSVILSKNKSTQMEEEEEEGAEVDDLQ